MHMSFRLPFAASVFLLAVAPLRAEEPSVHFVKTKQLEFVDSGGLEAVTLEIKAASFASPFTWSISVSNATGVLFSVTRDDAWLDGNFGEPGYVLDCHGYTDCKRKWYFSDLIKAFEESARPAVPRKVPPESWEIQTLQSLASDYLSEENVTPEAITIAIMEMRESLMSGSPRLVVPLTPVIDDSHFMYVRSLNRFVPYWDD